MQYLGYTNNFTTCHSKKYLEVKNEKEKQYTVILTDLHAISH